MDDYWERVDRPGLKVSLNGPEDSCAGGFPIGFCGQTEGMIREAVAYYCNLQKQYPDRPKHENIVHLGIGGMCMTCNNECKIVIEAVDGRSTERLKFIFAE